MDWFADFPRDLCGQLSEAFSLILFYTALISLFSFAFGMVVGALYSLFSWIKEYRTALIKGDPLCSINIAILFLLTNPSSTSIFH